MKEASSRATARTHRARVIEQLKKKGGSKTLICLASLLSYQYFDSYRSGFQI